MKAIEDLKNHKLTESSFLEMRKQLDKILIDNLDQDIWPSWDLRSGVAQGLKILRADFRTNLGAEPIVQSYVFHNLTLDEAYELVKMLDAFDVLAD